MGVEFAEQIWRLRGDGFCHFDSHFVESELADVSEATQEMIDNWHKSSCVSDDFWSWTPEGEDPILYRIHNLEKGKDRRINEFLNCPGLKNLTKVVFGCEVTATAFALVVKVPNRGSGIPWHRDCIDVPPCSVFNFSIYLDDSNTENGCLEVDSGSHISQEVENKKPNMENRVYLPANKGDVLVHDVRALHGSGSSTSSMLRRSIVIEYTPYWVTHLRDIGKLKVPEYLIDR